MGAQKYNVLRFLSVISKVVGVITSMFGAFMVFILFIGAVDAPPQSIPLFPGGPILTIDQINILKIGGAIWFVLMNFIYFLGGGELLELIVDLADTNRRTADLLERAIQTRIEPK